MMIFILTFFILTFLILPIVLWAAGAAIFSAVTGTAIVMSKKKKYNLAVLGMAGAGKSLFLSTIRNADYAGKQTMIDDYDSFEYHTSEGVSVIIKKGIDMSGSEEYQFNYPKIIVEADIVLCFFDINKYFESLEYKRHCNSRFDMVFGNIKETKKEVFVVATHVDLVNLSNHDLEMRFRKALSDKWYLTLFENMVLLNVLNKKSVLDFVDTIFNHKNT